MKSQNRKMWLFERAPKKKLCQTDLNYTFLNGVGTRKLLEVKPNHVPSVTKTIRKKMHTKNYEYPFLYGIIVQMFFASTL